MSTIKAIGIRSTPKCVYYAIITSSPNGSEISEVDKINLPKALDFPEQLQTIRGLFADIIEEHNVSNACIRITETTAQSLSIDRISIEGVLQELISSSRIQKHKPIQISQIASLSGVPRDCIKPFIDKEGTLDFLDIGNDYNKEEREAILSAHCALNL